MTYQQPRDPNRDILRHRDRSLGIGTMLALAALIAAAVGIAFYVLSENPSGTATVNAPTVDRSVPGSTTGQGGVSKLDPGPAQNTPIPMPPAKPPAKR